MLVCFFFAPAPIVQTFLTPAISNGISIRKITMIPTMILTRKVMMAIVYNDNYDGNDDNGQNGDADGYSKIADAF